MNFKLLSVSLFSLATVSSFIPSLTPAAKASCVATDVNVQVALHGRKKPAQQSNNVNQNIADDCFGNSATNVGTQTAVGGRIQQVRNSNQNLSGGGVNPTGVPMPHIKVPINVQVDVPALPDNVRR